MLVMNHELNDSINQPKSLRRRARQKISAMFGILIENQINVWCRFQKYKVKNKKKVRHVGHDRYT